MVAVALLLSLLGLTQLCHAQESRYGDFLEGLSDATNTVSSLVSELLWPPCRFRANIAERVRERLNQTIKAQEEGVSILHNAFSAWEFQRDLGNYHPLVLSITGPTGVGKSETSYQIAQALFPTRNYYGIKKPCGFLQLRGEDYSNTSESFAQGIPHMQKLLRNRIAAHLKQTQGHAVILMDEVQKVQPGIMEVFLPMMETRGSLTYVELTEIDNYASRARGYWKMFQETTGLGSAGGKPSSSPSPSPSQTCQEGDGTCTADFPRENLVEVTRQISTENVIFLFVSDIGVEPMIKLLLKHGQRRDIPLPVLRSQVKQVLDDQWSRLMLGKAVKEIVPYLPLEQEHVQEILKLKLDQGGRQGREKEFWSRLLVDNAVLQELSGRRFIDYQRVKSGESIKYIATRGARSLENAGPLQDLQALIKKYMSPWRPAEILHVGLITAENKDRSKQLWKNNDYASNKPQLFLQWCSVDPCLFTSFFERNSTFARIGQFRSYASAAQCSQFFFPAHDEGSGASTRSDTSVVVHRAKVAEEFLQTNARLLPEDALSISDDYAFSSLCETVWFGRFPAI